MAMDTRKDPRAKVLSMTVRYKSATVDEFIEHHSHDVSRGGIFIKTPSPFPPGTLLKFEIRIQDEQSVLAGVGRVVWKREPAQVSTTETPAGMGVKFIKLDDKSKAMIARLVDNHGEAPSAYDRDGDGEGVPAAAKATSSPPAAAAAAPSAGTTGPSGTLPVPTTAPRQEKRASTMLGLGAIGSGKSADAARAAAAIEAAKADVAAAAGSGGGGFFPATNPEKEMPPAEERTVMKQAAELLQQALSEAGGSLADVGTADVKKDEAAKLPSTPPKAAVEPVAVAAAASSASDRPQSRAVGASSKSESARPAAVGVPAAGVPAAKAANDLPAPRKTTSERPKVAAPPAHDLEPEERSGGGFGKMMVIGLAAAGLLVIGYFAFSGGENPTPTNATETAKLAKTAAPEKTAEPVKTAVTADPVQTAEPAPSVSATASAATTATVAPKETAKPKETAAPKETAKPTAAPPPPKPPPPKPPPPSTGAPPPPKPPPPKPPKGDDIYE